MKKPICIIGTAFLCFLAVAPGLAQENDEACPYPKGRIIEDLAAVLAAHEEWWAKGGSTDPAITGKANLCNAKLTSANLQGAELYDANLQGAELYEANLQGAWLTWANLQGASLSEANLKGAKLRYANLQGAFLRGANLQEAYLVETNLQGADLDNSILIGANLASANLQEADLFAANLRGADLYQANLQAADLRIARLLGVRLLRANLQGADLRDADLARADLRATVLVEAKLSRASLSGAIYQPTGAPAQGWLSGLDGLQSIRFCPGETSGLAVLRTALKVAGLRDLEREATYALESGRTRHALLRWNGGMHLEACERVTRNRWAAIEGVFRLVFFEWTTDYGLAYGRPLLILLGLIGVCSVVYLPALLIPERILGGTGIYRIWPEGRIEYQSTASSAAKDVVVERLNPNLLAAVGLALYFSVVSAFHLGWRDLNVGTWIARLQPREYGLRARGWVRVVSGTQSIISVYLIAMWVLTYFGRPFE